MTKDNTPWVLVEAKSSIQPTTKSLKYFQVATKAPYVFQVTKEMDYMDYDCFEKGGTIIVPAKTFLSQLI